MIDFTNLVNLRTELTQAIRLNNLEQLKLILNNKFLNLNYIDKDGQSPLHRSCQLGQLPIVELLCEFGASQNMQNKDGWFPIHLAAYYGHMDIVFYLLKQQKNDILVIQTENNKLNRSFSNIKTNQENYDYEDDIENEEEDDDEYSDSSYNECETDDEENYNENSNVKHTKQNESNDILMFNFSNLKL